MTSREAVARGSTVVVTRLPGLPVLAMPMELADTAVPSVPASGTSSPDFRCVSRS